MNYTNKIHLNGSDRERKEVDGTWRRKKKKKLFKQEKKKKKNREKKTKSRNGTQHFEII